MNKAVLFNSLRERGFEDRSLYIGEPREYIIQDLNKRVWAHCFTNNRSAALKVFECRGIPEDCSGVACADNQGEWTDWSGGPGALFEMMRDKFTTIITGQFVIQYVE